MGEAFSGRPLTASLFRSVMGSPAARLAKLERFFKATLKTVESELQNFNSVPVKCSIAETTVVKFTPPAMGAISKIFACEGNSVTTWFEADRDFDVLIWELCLGGAGIAPDPADSDRPPSKFEKRLKAKVADAILASLPEAAKLAVGASWAVTTPPVVDRLPEEPKPETCTSIKILVNAFSITAEFTILMQQEQLEKNLNMAVVDASYDPNSPAPNLDDCKFELSVFMKPQLVPLEKLLNIKPGEFLNLEAKVNSPVSVHFADAYVFDAAINLLDDKIEVVLDAPLDAEAMG